MQSGQRPKAALLKFVQPPTGKRRVRPTARPATGNRPRRPPYLEGRAAALFDEIVALTSWIEAIDSYKLGMWCWLHSEWERAPSAMLSWRLVNLRLLAAELGLDPISRSRLNVSQPSEPDPADRFLGPRQ
jgi:phage terminase small subunit